MIAHSKFRLLPTHDSLLYADVRQMKQRKTRTGEIPQYVGSLTEFNIIRHKLQIEMWVGKSIASFCSEENE